MFSCLIISQLTQAVSSQGINNGIIRSPPDNVNVNLCDQEDIVIAFDVVTTWKSQACRWQAYREWTFYGILVVLLSAKLVVMYDRFHALLPLTKFVMSSLLLSILVTFFIFNVCSINRCQYTCIKTRGIKHVLNHKS